MGEKEKKKEGFQTRRDNKRLTKFAEYKFDEILQ